MTGSTTVEPALPARLLGDHHKRSGRPKPPAYRLALQAADGVADRRAGPGLASGIAGGWLWVEGAGVGSMSAPLFVDPTDFLAARPLVGNRVLESV